MKQEIAGHGAKAQAHMEELLKKEREARAADSEAYAVVISRERLARENMQKELHASMAERFDAHAARYEGLLSEGRSSHSQLARALDGHTA